MEISETQNILGMVGCSLLLIPFTVVIWQALKHIGLIFFSIFLGIHQLNKEKDYKAGYQDTIYKKQEKENDRESE